MIIVNNKKKILVTGGCGFIGSNFINYTVDTYGEKYDIYNIDKLTYASNTSYVKSSDVTHGFFDLIDTEKVFDFFKENGPFDYIFHFAAESHVDRSIDDPHIFVKSNVLGTQVLLDCFNKQNRGRYIHISTDEVYGHLNYKDPSFTEETPLNPRSPYSASKASSDLLVLSYFTTYGSDVCITRCCNNYGENQHHEKFIPTIVKKLKNNQKIPVYGNGLNIREWIHVIDHVEAIWLVAKKGKRGDIYNVGSGIETSNIELVDEICKLLEKDLDNSVIFVRDRLGHDFRYSINSNKLKNLNWYPVRSVNFIESLTETVNFYVNS